jgi:ferredoxin-thioredoxin reductase catalytic subunit|nr:MAG TPA_asm: ferredoxin-thioredoxin reductase [Caudoviricetes sp.]
MIKIITNPDKEFLEEIIEKVNDNDGYCPCALQKIPDTKCMCKEFRDQISKQELGECHCGRYIIVNNEEE